MFQATVPHGKKNAGQTSGYEYITLFRLIMRQNSLLICNLNQLFGKRLVDRREIGKVFKNPNHCIELLKTNVSKSFLDQKLKKIFKIT